MSLRDGNKKMSKSEESDYSRINLKDTADEINKKMLGGVVLKYKDNEIDLSVDNKLDGLNSVLTN